MGTGAPRAPFLVARGVPSLRAAGGANVGSVSSGDRGGRALGVRCAIQRRPRSPGFAVAWLCGCAQWHTSGHGRPSSLRTVDGTTTRVSLRARQRGGRGSTGSEVGCVCVCALPHSVVAWMCGHAQVGTHARARGSSQPGLHHRSVAGRPEVGRWRAARAPTSWQAVRSAHLQRRRICSIARKLCLLAGRRRELPIVCPWVIAARRFLHQYSRNWYIYSSTQHGRKKGAPPAGRTPVLPSSARSS